MRVYYRFYKRLYDDASGSSEIEGEEKKKEITRAAGRLMHSVVAALTRLYHVHRVKRASTRVKSTYEASYTVAWHASSG